MVDNPNISIKRYLGGLGRGCSKSWIGLDVIVIPEYNND
jgi:hypothetical protein